MCATRNATSSPPLTAITTLSPTDERATSVTMSTDARRLRAIRPMHGRRRVDSYRLLRVQFQQLRSFVTVAELRHFTQAADRIGIAQPSLSKQIHSLEADLGTPLFERGPAGVALTQAGEALLPF